MRSPSDVKGFTLIEVMVALFVVAVALPALMFQLGTQLTSTEVLRDKSLASWVAQDQLAMHKLQSVGTAAGELQGERQLAGRQWPWSLTIETTPVPGMVRQTVSVYADITSRQQQRDALVVVTTFTRNSSASVVP